MKHGSVRSMTQIGFLAALLAICSQISIPLPFTPVPVNLATFAVFLIGGVLGARAGAVCIAVYMMLGVCGLPIFSNFGSGLGALLGPTGGYLWGYFACAVITGAWAKKLPAAFGMAAGLCVCYAFGTIWFMLLTKTPLLPALIGCVVPFLPGDACKILAADFALFRLKTIKK